MSDFEENIQLNDQEEQNRRLPLWLLLLLLLLLFLLGLWGFSSINQDVLGEEETQNEQVGDEPTDEPTSTATPTDTPTPGGDGEEEEGAPSDPTPTNTLAPEDEPPPIVPVNDPEPECGNGICEDGENSDLCREDCGCVDDGICNPDEEGYGCRDCQGPDEELASVCGSACPTGECAGGLSCTGGVCWQACVCDDNCGTDDDDDEKACTPEGTPFFFCDGVKLKLDDGCGVKVVESCSCLCGCSEC